MGVHAGGVDQRCDMSQPSGALTVQPVGFAKACAIDLHASDYGASRAQSVKSQWNNRALTKWMARCADGCAITATSGLDSSAKALTDSMRRSITWSRPQ